MLKMITAALLLILLTASAGANTSRSCLTSDTLRELSMIEARFGKVNIVSTCVRKFIAGTRHMSYHSFGRAVDFVHPNKSAIVQYLKTRPVLVMTYRTHGHIHFNTGQKGVILGANGFGGGGRKYARMRVRHVQRVQTVSVGPEIPFLFFQPVQLEQKRVRYVKKRYYKHRR
jgi:hypothetical protein